MSHSSYHTNTTLDWHYFTHLTGTYGGQNPHCSYTSQQCSMIHSDIPDLCQWHRLRMGYHMQKNCACKINDVCMGDAVARDIFRQYYNCPNIPVIDTSNRLYCCGQCQNCDGETHYCGDMLVGECCIDLHPQAHIIINYDSNSENDWCSGGDIVNKVSDSNSDSYTDSDTDSDTCYSNSVVSDDD